MASRRLLTKTMHPCRSTATAPVWARDHFQIVAVGVGKIDPASAVVMIDLAGAATPRVGPVPETLLTDAAEDCIEISLGNQESVVLWLDRSIGGRGVYFPDPDGHYLEVITRPYGSGGS